MYQIYINTNKLNTNNMNTQTIEKKYIGPYKVYKVFRVSRRREIIRRGLTIDEAKRLVNSYPDSSRSMVVFSKQFTGAKYFI